MIHDAEILDRLHITLSHVDAANVEEHEEIVLQRFYDLVIEISAARCWSQTLYTTCLPNFFAAIHHVDMAERKACMQQVRDVWTAVLAAEEYLRSVDANAEVKKALAGILADAAWHKLQVSRELLAVCRQGGFDPADEETRRLAWLLFASPANTKFTLEDRFGHMADIASRFSRQFRMSKQLARVTVAAPPSILGLLEASKCNLILTL